MIKIGDKINFSLKNQSGTTINSSDFLGKYIILYFYPKDNTPGCSIQAMKYKNLYPDFINLNAEIFGISKDSEKSHAKFSCDKNIPFDLLVDEQLQFTEQLGFAGYKQMYGKQYYSTIRSSIVIDDKGFVAMVNNNVDPNIDAEKVLQFLKEV